MDEGKPLRVNRSIQAESAFGQIKHSRKSVRFLTAGNILAWLWFMFVNSVCFIALSVQADVEKGPLQILMLLQQLLL